MILIHDRNTLGADTQRSYLKAVECLHFKNPSREFDPANGTLGLFRIDDYIKVLLTEGYLTAFSGLHLHWQRVLLHIYEQELREECGYNGTLPYWDFSRFAPNITADPIFKGNTSLGGDGQVVGYPSHVGHGDVSINYFTHNYIIPPGSGGGCVQNPPATHGISTYPLAWPDNANSPNSTFDHSYLTRNPRCITRDLNAFTSHALTYNFVEKAIACDTYACLLDSINGSPKGTILPIEIAARATVGGLQLDPYIAASDPLWWLLAANVDRLWALWQGQNPNVDQRFNEVTGTKSPWMSNVTMPVALSDTLYYGALQGNKTQIRLVKDGKSTIEGHLCYRYSEPLKN
ncbi:Di-copper centre-containing protein [Lophiostoma macrostomum CBS 122681]|uniref:Di-copper centre-containing protein n=1 Tax=Lophiostoma macrostomum CBS 122681 TaxID=1314788 RepID=A0A6A6TSU5_9PLEO|nr:Di-copper centre-containing protein [Lophiostoma macrostomum CBS 122681]